MGSNWLSTLSQSYHPVLTYPGAGGGPTLCLVNLMSFVFPSLRARSGRRPDLCKEHTNTALGVANAACTSSDELDPHQSLQQPFVRVWSRTHVKKATLNISHDRPGAGRCCFLRFGGTYVGITRCILLGLLYAAHTPPPPRRRPRS